MREYYPVNIIIDSTSHLCIWFSNDKDGLITESAKIKCFSKIEDLYAYATVNSIQLDEHIAVYDIDTAVQWLKRKRGVDCSYFNGYWSLVDDMADSLGIRFYGERRTKYIDRIYEKLLFGCNLPALKRDGEIYIPEFSKKEINILSKVVRDGLRIIRKFL